MRWVVASLLVLMVTFSDTALAQSAPLVRTIAKHLVMQTNDGGCDPTTCQVDYTLQCPAGYIASAYWVSLQYPFDVNVELARDLIDSSTTQNRGNRIVAIQKPTHIWRA